MNNELYLKLKTIESYLITSFYHGYYRQLSKHDLELAIDGFTQLYGHKPNDNVKTCPSCLLTMLQKIGKDYCEYKVLKGVK